jgi:hypothetical protein
MKADALLAPLRFRTGALQQAVVALFAAFVLAGGIFAAIEIHAMRTGVESTNTGLSQTNAQLRETNRSIAAMAAQLATTNGHLRAMAGRIERAKLLF